MKKEEEEEAIFCQRAQNKKLFISLEQHAL